MVTPVLQWMDQGSYCEHSHFSKEATWESHIQNVIQPSNLHSHGHLIVLSFGIFIELFSNMEHII